MKNLRTCLQGLKVSRRRYATKALKCFSMFIDTLCLVLELASGSGEHLTKLAQKLPDITFYPTEGDPMLLPSIEAWTKHFNVQNVAKPTELNFGSQVFSHPVDAAWVVNVTHITPWADTVGLFTNLAQVLGPGAWLGIYGAFNRNGQFSSPSNKDVSYIS